MKSNYAFGDLKNQVADGQGDTVLVTMVDMQGRLMGKQFHTEAFVEVEEFNHVVPDYKITRGFARA